MYIQYLCAKNLVFRLKKKANQLTDRQGDSDIVLFENFEIDVVCFAVH